LGFVEAVLKALFGAAGCLAGQPLLAEVLAGRLMTTFIDSRTLPRSSKPLADDRCRDLRRRQEGDSQVKLLGFDERGKVRCR